MDPCDLSGSKNCEKQWDFLQVSPLISQVPFMHLTISDGMNMEALADWIPEQGHMEQILQLTHRRQTRSKKQPLIK